MAIIHGTEASETIDMSDDVTINADLIYGYGGSDHIQGFDGNDTIYGGEGDDWLEGMDDNDILKGGGGADRLNGGRGIDTVSYADAPAWVAVFLEPGHDAEGYAAGDILEDIENLNGSAYNDSLIGNAGANTLAGLNGNDALEGGGGADTLNGGNGVDAATYVFSGAGVVVSLVTGTGGGGEAEGDVLIGIEDIYGSRLYRDVLVGDENTNHLHGLGGDDSLYGRGGNDFLYGLQGHDVLDGGSGADRMYGGTLNDTYYVDNAADLVFELGGEGMDTVRASASYALPAGADVELLATGSDIGTAAINLTGNASGNAVRGNDGNNVINGGNGNDELTGRAGMDWFLFDTPLDTMFNVDVITDFNVVDDTIRLDATIFSSGLTPDNSVAGSQFVVGSAALDAGDRIIYDNATGDVFYDSDGTGATAAIRFAQVDAGLVLTNFDFFVV